MAPTVGSWVICDGSKSGVGAVYGQGPEWQRCQPAGFLSKKFSPAQQRYRTHEHETIAIVEALMKWEDKLLGRAFTLVTDQKSLEYFETQQRLSDRQVRWWEFLSHFNYTVVHVDGKLNKVADCLSHYYEFDYLEEKHPDNPCIHPAWHVLAALSVQSIRPLIEDAEKQRQRG